MTLNAFFKGFERGFWQSFDQKNIPAYTQVLQPEKSVSRLFPGSDMDVVANDRCII